MPWRSLRARSPTSRTARTTRTPVVEVTFDGGFSRASDGGENGLSYYWEFGDGSHAVGKVVHHTYAAAGWYDVKLAVVKGQKPKWGTYRQTVKVGSPGAAAPTTAACGTLTPAERTPFVDAAQKAIRKPSATAREN